MAAEVRTVKVDLGDVRCGPRRFHSSREAHSGVPVGRRRPTSTALRRTPPASASDRRSELDRSISGGANSSLGAIEHDKAWNSYGMGAHKERSPDNAIAPAPAAARAARPVSLVAATLATDGANYALPPLFRDSFPAAAVVENAAGRQAAAAALSDEEVEDAWQAALALTASEGGAQPHPAVSDAAARSALATVWQDLAEAIFSAALASQMTTADTRAAHRTAGYTRGARRPPSGSNPVPPLTRERFGWLARYLGHFEQLWFLCECLEEHEDVPLTLREFKCACANLGVTVSRRQAVQATKHAESGGVLGFCGWHAARRCNEDLAASVEESGSDDEFVDTSATESAAESTARQLFVAGQDATHLPAHEASDGGGWAVGARQSDNRLDRPQRSVSLELSSDEQRPPELQRILTSLKQAMDAKRSVFGQTIQNPSDVFAAFDRDRSGTLSADELGKALKRLGRGFSDAQLQRLMDSLDVNGDGEIDFRELMAALPDDDRSTRSVL